jgi:signal transduction histidine kinase
MHQNRLFNRTRLKLAAWYAGVMGLILSACGVAVYLHLAKSHFEAIDSEIQTLTGTLHDSLEPVLEEPGQLHPRVKQVLPGLCIGNVPCQAPIETSHIHVLGIDQQEPYYVKFTDLSSRLLATVNTPPQTKPPEGEGWHTLIDEKGLRYHQFSLLLKTSTGQPWGYLQVGRSLSGYDSHLASLRVFLLVGLPIAMVSIGGASWWLAGLAMKPVYESYQQVQQFTADAAHELRTPLAAIQATVETTLGAQDLTLIEAQSTLQTITRQNQRLVQLVQDLLMLSRIDLQVLPIKQQNCCLNDLVQDLVEEFAALAIASEISLELSIQTDTLYVIGDEEQLYRLVTNLITNAIQYSRPEGVVTLRLLKEDHTAIIQVEDTGVGIAITEQSRIFDRFYRVNRDRSRQTGGAGLGLAIAQAIANAHQGSIQVKSQIGQGSIFTVHLPLRTSRQSKV